MSMSASIYSSELPFCWWLTNCKMTVLLLLESICLEFWIWIQLLGTRVCSICLNQDTKIFLFCLFHNVSKVYPKTWCDDNSVVGIVFYQHLSKLAVSITFNLSVVLICCLKQITTYIKKKHWRENICKCLCVKLIL